ncbi:MAG TPA: VRR-NUC domain-containing protein [Gaiellaceae bacterium]|nr:VRR-NUC domain-containing protein [Gaiellaceae bacterium]
MTRLATSERELQDAILNVTRLRGGWLAYHTHDSRHSASGFPDLVLARRGMLVFAELKDATSKPTLAQRDWLDALAAAHQHVYLWRPAHLTDVATFLLGQTSPAPGWSNW